MPAPSGPAFPHDTRTRGHRPELVSGGGRGLQDFFRYHGIWAPGVRLFRAIGFRTKALVISAVFALPLLHLSWQYFSAAASQINNTRMELAGTAVFRELVPVYRGMLESRSAAQARQAGYAPAAERLTDARKRTDEALAKLQASLGQGDDALALKPGLQKLQQAWAATAGARDGVDDKGQPVFGPAIEAATELLSAAGDNSQLVLDPDLDSFYIVNALVLTLPKTLEDLSQLWAYGLQAAVKGPIGGADEARWHVWSARVLSGVDDTKGFIARVVAANADLKPRLDTGLLDPALALRKTGSAAVFEATRPAPADCDAAGDAALSRVAEIYVKWLPVLDDVLQARLHRDEGSRALSASVLVVSLVLVLYLFISFRKVLDGGLREVALHIDAMRNGDLTTRPRAWGRDEAAGLMNTLSQMQQELRRIVSQVRGASDTIVAASSEISGGASDLHTRTEMSAANLEETASAMEEIASTVRSNEATVDEAARLATTNAQAAERGGQIIGQVVQTMQSINTSSGRIGDIIGTIEGIAFQTNILALNAAVEAARAGEQGRGFAVVASEVRALAQRSAAAAKEIKSLITASVEQVEGGVRVVRQAGEAIDEIVGTARHVHKLLGDVAVAAREQTAGVSQSAKAVQELDSVTQQNAALVEQTAAAATTLKDQAHSLAGEVAQFQLPAA